MSTQKKAAPDMLTGVNASVDPAAQSVKNGRTGSRTVVHLPNTTKPTADTQSFGAVLRKYRSRHDMNQPKLAEILGVSRNTIINWEADKCRPDFDSIRELSTMLGIPLYELFGLTNDAMPTPHENILLEQYRQLSAVGQKVVDKVISSMLAEEIDARDAYLQEKFFVLPLESTPAAVGPGCTFNDAPPEYRFIKENGYNRAADALIRVSGASMEPHYHDGDMVYIKYTNAADDGDDVICSTADGAVIKRVRNHKLYSLNRDLPFGEKSEDDHVVILGRVLGIVSEEDFPNEADIQTLEELKSQEIREFDRGYGLD